jgi:hypothetical protein
MISHLTNDSGRTNDRAVPEAAVYPKAKISAASREEDRDDCPWFCCVDGIVLCADQQISAEGWHKFNETKMYAIRSYDPISCILITYAGDPHVMKAFHQKLGTLTAKNTFDSVSTLQLLIEQVLSAMTPEAVETNFLCGFCMQGAIPGLLRTKEYSVYQIGDHDHIGVGDSSLVRFLSKLLISHPIKSSLAVFVGDYIVKQAKTFIDGCGGPTDIYVLRPDGTCAPPWFKQTEQAANAADVIERDIPHLLWMISHGQEQVRIQSLWNDLQLRVADFINPAER